MIKRYATLEDARIRNVRHENLHYQLPQYKSREEWLERAKYLRQHILACCGLWPPLKKTPLNPRIFKRIERDDYAVEEVYFESYPGFFVTGNLYTPLGKEPLFPAVLCPHGHWKNGRLEDSDLVSVPGRCINFAKQGYVVFSHDMVGYMDSFQVCHDFGSQKVEILWGIGLAGLQLWNNICSLDFLQSLDFVDPKRIGCTGASGGGTQTFLLTAVDERVSVAAPVNMVSAHFQGGCLCENPPNLRIETFNVEIASLAAPRPLLLVSAKGDWTRETPLCEYPSVKRIYRLFNAEEKVKCIRIDADHNYNKESREAAYSWFGRWLLNKEDETLFCEKPFKVEDLPKLMVFYGASLPETGINSETLRSYLISRITETIESLKPKSFGDLNKCRKVLAEIYSHSLMVSEPKEENIEAKVLGHIRLDEAQVKKIILSHNGIGDAVPAFEAKPLRGSSKGATLIVHEKGKGVLLNFEKKEISTLVKNFLRLSQTVLLIDCFAIGEYLNNEEILDREKGSRHFTTYNKTVVSERVQDILTAIAYLKTANVPERISLVGLGEGGLWCLLARGLAKGVNSTVIDINGFNQSDDEEWLQRLFIPLIRRAGGLDTAIALVAPSKLFIYNCKDKFEPYLAVRLYEMLNASKNLRIEKDKAEEIEMIRWITKNNR